MPRPSPSSSRKPLDGQREIALVGGVYHYAADIVPTLLLMPQDQERSGLSGCAQLAAVSIISRISVAQLPNCVSPSSTFVLR